MRAVVVGVVLVALVGCDHLLGLEHGTARDAPGAVDASIDIDAAPAPAVVLTIPGLTTVSPTMSSGSSYQILDPRIEGIQTVCSGGYCLAGGLTP